MNLKDYLSIFMPSDYFKWSPYQNVITDYDNMTQAEKEMLRADELTARIKINNEVDFNVTISEVNNVIDLLGLNWGMLHKIDLDLFSNIFDYKTARRSSEIHALIYKVKKHLYEQFRGITSTLLILDRTIKIETIQDMAMAGKLYDYVKDMVIKVVDNYFVTFPSIDVNDDTNLVIDRNMSVWQRQCIRHEQFERGIYRNFAYSDKYLSLYFVLAMVAAARTDKMKKMIYYRKDKYSYFYIKQTSHLIETHFCTDFISKLPKEEIEDMHSRVKNIVNYEMSLIGSE